MNIAVVKTGGKQYVVKEGDVITVEKLSGGEKVELETLLIDNGSEVDLKPASKVAGTVMSEGLAKKVVVVKYKAKSRYYKKRGHRQPFTKVKIEKI